MDQVSSSGLREVKLPDVPGLVFSLFLIAGLMQRHFRLKMLVVVLLLQPFMSGEASGRAENDQASPRGNVESQKHGSPEILLEKLIRVRELEGLLKSVSVGKDGRLSALAAEFLQKIFARPYDVFQMDPATGISQSIRAKAFRILRESSPTVQRDWMQATAVLAESKLRDAMLMAERSRLDDVTREFPMTEQGIRAQILSMTRDFLQGSVKDIEVRLALMESEYSGTVLEKFLRQQSLSLKARLKAAAGKNSRYGSVDASQGTSLSISTTTTTGSLAPPWPAAKWEWRESVWNYPGAPQPEAGTALESFVPETASSLSEFSNWRPIFWGDSIVLRSPFRLMAFDRKSGQQRWSLPTNTYTPDNEMVEESPEGPDELTLGFGPRPTESSSIGGLAAFGLLSFDDDYLFFIDHFDFFRRNPTTNRFRQPAFNRNGVRLVPVFEDSGNARSFATRLVALRRTAADGLPQVAWIAGDSQGFRYQPVAPAADNSAESPVRDNGIGARHEVTEPKVDLPESPTPVRDRKFLKGHRFLCPPVGTGQRLFVLTIHDDEFWLSCVSKTGGEVIWQQPLIFSDDLVSRVWDSLNQSNGTSVCLLCDKTVVCSLSEGILVGVRATDGQLSWATAIRNKPPTRQSPGFRAGLMSPEEAESIDTTTVLVPVASESIVVCASNPSAGIHGIDATSGEILWTVPRQAFGPGDVGGSPDLYIAGITETQVVLIGERHCRSLDLKTGNQNWVVSISRTSGRAECRGDRCLIPLDDGQIMTVNLKDGKLLPRRQTFLPENATLLFGSITSDQNVVCASTPVSIAVFPRVDTLLSEPAPKEVLTRNSVEQILTRARANLINGDSEKAISLLTAEALDESDLTDPALQELIDRYLGELILQGWGEKYVNSLQQPEGTEFSRLSDSDQATLLARLSLSEDQQLRSAVLVALSQSRKELAPEIYEELTEFRGWTSPMSIDETWRVRPDLLLLRSENRQQLKSTPSMDITPFRLRQLAEKGILFPEIFASDNDRQKFVNRLVTSGEYAAAESFLGAWIEMNGPTSRESLQPREMLTQVRERDVIAGYLVSEVREHFRPTDAPDTANPTKGLTSESSGALVIDFQPTLRNPSWERQLVEKGFPLDVLPDWNRLRYFLIDGRDGFPDLVSMDMSDGSLRDRVALPFPLYRYGLGFRPTGTDMSIPGFLPIAGADQIAMYSCSIPERTKLLWTRRYRDAAATDAGIEFGPLGADHFVWHFHDEMHCTHPITGQDLWVRTLRLSESDKIFSGVRRIFGDRVATVVMGSDASSFERFSTRDGRLLGSGRLTVGRTTDPETVGRFLFYPDPEGRLHLFDGQTGGERLEDNPPILLGPLNSRHAFQVLSEGRVVTVSSSMEIILIDTASGKIVFRTSALDHIKEIGGLRRVFRLTAFERNGQLFVGLDDEIDDNRGSLDSFIRDREPRINSGPLLCLNPHSGQILWSTRLMDAVIPSVYGDPTDLLVTLSQKSDDQDPRRPRKETLEIQLINEKTGEIVEKSTSAAASRPFRCVHMATTKTIEIISKDSVISIHAETKPGETP